MKLRNKKTGRILEAEKILFGNGRIGDALEWNTYQPAVSSLAELNKEWEDYKPAEPLIKDEKIRKAIRAWLAIQGQPIVAAAITCNKDEDGFFNYCLYGYIEEARMSGGKPVVNKNLTAIDFEFRSLEKIEFERHRDYTITELCGEEDE